MAELTRLDDAEVRALARGFRLGGVSAWGEVPAGTINSNYWLEAGGRRWFLRVNEGKTEDDVRWESALVAALVAAGVPTPPPALTEEGAPLVLHRDRWVSVFPWIAGVHRERGEVSEDDAALVGAALAQLHRAAAPLARTMPRAGIYTTAHIAGRFARLRSDPEAAADPQLAGALAAVGEELAWLDERRAEREAAPGGIIHGDLFRDNVLFAAGGARLVALLDFEQASSGAWVYDLAVCLNAWCFAGSLSPALVRSMVGGYAAVRALEPAERALLPVEVRAAAMRFTVTRITDVYCRGLSQPDKDFRRFLVRLEAWRLLGAEGLAGWLGAA
ncbi:MAG TPA: homoserine kinase [Kofleriaceae bacterium]|nr:homoserine kinase [Kofleriaceae bacterium]